MDFTPTRLTGLVAVSLLSVLAATIGAAELPFRQFLPDYDSHILSSASVQKLHQDAQGYVWIGFYSSGLSRYNGNSTIRYGLADGLVDLTVREVIEDDEGHLWVGSDSGIVISDKPLHAYQRGERVQFVTSVGETKILQTRVRRNTMHVSADGTIWIGSTGQGIAAYRWSGGRLTERRIGTHLRADGPQQPVHSIYSLDGGEQIVASIGDSLLATITPSSDDSLGTVISPDAGAPGSPVSAWLADRGGTIWAGAVDGTLWRSKSLRTPFERIASPLTGARIVEIVETRSANIWLAALGTGAARFSPDDLPTMQHYTRENGLISETVWSLLLDHEGNLWFAQNGGLSRLMSDFEAFSFYGNSLPDHSCFASLPPIEGPAGDPYLWVGTGGGVAVIAPDGSTARLTIEHGLPHNSIYALMRDRLSRVWIGSVGGFSILDFESRAGPDGSVSDFSQTLHGDRVRVLNYPFQITYSIREISLPRSPGSTEMVPFVWIAGQSGIRVIGDGLSLSFRQNAGLPGTGAVDIALDSGAYMWVATTDRGVFRSREVMSADLLRSLRSAPDGKLASEVRPSLFSPLWDVTTGAPTNSVRNLLAVGNRIWAGTAHGLAVFDAGSDKPITILDRSNGLGGETIAGLEIDPSGEAVWVSQNEGIVRVDAGTMTVTRMVTTGEGLLDNEAWASRSIQVETGGTVYLATPKGLSIYRPWLDSPTLSRPLLRIDRADISQGRLGHRESLFEFAPLTYVNEQDVVYRTRLRGYDEDWSDPTSEARIRYTNLPAFGFPRLYTFQVMAKSGDGVWTEPKSFGFRALPPWWSRWWALVAWILVFIAILVAYNRFHTLSLARQNTRLEMIVNERTGEIAAQAMEIDTLDRIVQIINQEVEFEKVLRVLLEQGMVLFPEAERGGSLIYDHERGTMNIPTAIGYDPRVLSKIRLSAADARRRYETGGTEIDRGIYLLRSLGDLPGVTDVEGVPAPKSMLAMAITIDDRVEAFLVFENFERVNAFQNVNLRTARRYKEHARTAVAKALILRELELRNRETQRANEAKSTFLANMSHELRTPLNSIIGFSELLVERIGEEIDERHRHFLRLILSSGQHLLAIINDILDLSKVEAGKMQLIPERFDLRLAIEGVQQVMRPVAAKKDVTIEILIEPGTPPIETDPGKFKQILYNLVSNAVKFSEAGSIVKIRGGIEPETGMIAVAVQDEGIGIAKDQLETIFDEFKQVENSMSRRFEGTGLGLSLVRRFVDFLGGSVEVESVLGEGSTFTVRVPAELPFTLKKSEREAKRVERTRGRVLVVEDDDESWELIRDALEEAELSSVRAATGEEGLRLAKTLRPDAITLDISLPGELSGWDVLKSFKGDRETEDIPVVIISHSPDHELGIALGAEDYLVKPVSAEQLNHRLQELVAFRRGDRVHRLLLIDDDHLVHQILGGFLRDAGYEPLSALTGGEGVKMAIDMQPDVIILDLTLPDLSGIQVAETLRQLDETRSIPVIVLTSKDPDTIEQANLEHHLEKIVRKGTGTQPALLEAIERVLPRRGRHSQVS